MLCFIYADLLLCVSSDFWVVLCGARSWPQWSSSLEYSMTVWFFGFLDGCFGVCRPFCLLSLAYVLHLLFPSFYHFPSAQLSVSAASRREILPAVALVPHLVPPEVTGPYSRLWISSSCANVSSGWQVRACGTNGILAGGCGQQ